MFKQTTNNTYSFYIHTHTPQPNTHFIFMSSQDVLRVINRNPNGLWIRQLARKAHLSPATICNYIYGYYDRHERFVKPVITKQDIEIVKMGAQSLTLIKPLGPQRRKRRKK